VARLAAHVANRDTKDRRTAYLAHAYACHEMALRTGDADDRAALRAMTLVWEVLAQRASSSLG